MKKTSSFVLFILVAMALSACATMNRGNSSHSGMTAADGTDESDRDDDDDVDGVAHAPIDKKEVSSSEISANEHKAYKSEYGEINLKSNSYVEKWINYFQGRGRPYMETYLSRSTRYLPMMRNTLRENGLPEDLVYVALIESGFSPMAHSRASAVGYWQFIRGTAKRYGLTVNRHIDERRDPVLSTRAAADFFKALYNLFGSWHLALASYNTGENRVKNVVMKTYSRDFWELVRRRRLPDETLNYVPKFIAAALIAKDPAKYGFTNIAYQPTMDYETVDVDKPINLRTLAQGLNIPFDDLRLLNPKYRGDYVPVSSNAPTVLRVPTGMKAQALAAVPASVTKAIPRMAASDDFDTYRVKRGDSLSTIAKRHRTSIATLRRMNHLTPRSILRVGQRLRVPDRYDGDTIEQRVPSSSSRVPTQVVVHVVKRTAGEKLKTRRTTARVHVVKRGETLLGIARSYQKSIQGLARANDMAWNAKLDAGRTLVIP